MSRPISGPTRLPPKSSSGRRPRKSPSLPTSNRVVSGELTRRTSGTSAPKAQRTSKTSQKLVVLPSGPQTRPLLLDDDEDLTLGHETDGGIREYKSEAERMTKAQRKQAGFKRLTVYCVAESFRMNLLASFLKREHNVFPRVFDEALYTMYHLPLLPGYGPNTNVRSSTVSTGKAVSQRLSEAEENGYRGTYFTSSTAPNSSSQLDGYISSSSPVDTRKPHPPPTFSPSEELPTPSSDIEGFAPDSSTENLISATETEMEPETEAESSNTRVPRHFQKRQNSSPKLPEEEVGEVIFFEYGVAVFFGLTEAQERDILEDIDRAGIMQRKMNDGQWEIEECHFAHDRDIAYPRIYNDFFTLKSRSHLLKLSIAHALAQSTLLAHYESTAQRVLSSPMTLAIPKQLASSGKLQLRRHDALKLTGRLFKLRRDVNLVSNVLDVPELFWSEASLGELYRAVREYMELNSRIEALNEKLGVASDFLDAIHDHLNNSAMERITWIIIWLIVVAILVELGEVLARLVVHSSSASTRISAPISVLTKDEALRTLERMLVQQ